MDLQLAGRRAIVTGASRGIGRVIASTLATEGADVVIAARTEEPLRRAAKEISEESGAAIHPVVADTGSDRSVANLVAEAVRLLGGVDILVNNAATPGGSSRERSAIAVPGVAVASDFDAKVLGYLRVAQHVAPHFVRQGWGRIINIGGLSYQSTGFLSGTLRNVGVVALGKTLADELGPQGVAVTTLHPGATRTERTSDLIAANPDFEAHAATTSTSDRLTDALEVAWVVAFLASPKSVAINGESIAVGGGTRGRIDY